MGDWVWWIVVGSLVGTGVFALVVVLAQWYYRHRYLDHVVRIFEEKPLFIIPRGNPVPGAEDVHFETSNGCTLRGCYLMGRGSRRGVILFGLEFGCNRWACVQYCTMLLDRGYDVFAYEPRNQGESDRDPNYAPLQWVTDRDVIDMKAAVLYLKRRKDAPAGGIGLFGISKGASVAMVLAANDPWVRCIATDGAYGTYTTMVPYMRRWVSIYIKTATRIRAFVPDWFYGLIGLAAIRESASRRGVKFVSVERALRRLDLPLLMIHGSGDTYIKPEMAEALFEKAGTPQKVLWMVNGAKHNQALNVAGTEYARRLEEFFDKHLADGESVTTTPLPHLPTQPRRAAIVAK